MSSAAVKPEHIRVFSVLLNSFLALVALIFRQRHLLNTTPKIEQRSLISQELMERTSRTVDQVDEGKG